MIIGLAIPDSSSPSESSFKAESSFRGLASPNSQSASLFAKHLDQAAIDASFDSALPQIRDLQFRGAPSKRNFVERELGKSTSSHGTSSSELTRRSQSGAVQSARAKQAASAGSPHGSESNSRSSDEVDNGRRSQQTHDLGTAKAQFSRRQAAQAFGRRIEAEAPPSKYIKEGRSAVGQEPLLPAVDSKESMIEAREPSERSENPAREDHPKQAADSLGPAGGETNGSDPGQANAGGLLGWATTEQPGTPSALLTGATIRDTPLSQSSIAANPQEHEEGEPLQLEAGASGGWPSSATLGSTSEAQREPDSTRLKPGATTNSDATAYGGFGTGKDGGKIRPTAPIGPLLLGQLQSEGNQFRQDPLTATVPQPINNSSQNADSIWVPPQGKTVAEGTELVSSSRGMSEANSANPAQVTVAPPLDAKETVSTLRASEMGLFMGASSGPTLVAAQPLPHPVAAEGSKGLQASAFDAASGWSQEAGSMNLDLRFDPMALSPAEEAISQSSAAGETGFAAQAEHATGSNSSFGNDPESGSRGAENKKDLQFEAESWLSAGAGRDTPTLDSPSAEAIRSRSLNPVASRSLAEETTDGIRQSQQPAGQPLEQEQLGTGPSTVAEQPITNAPPSLPGQSGASSSSPANSLNPKDPAQSARSASLEVATQKPLASSVHQLRIEIPVPGADGSGNEKIQLHFNQRNSALNLGIQANNSDLGMELRDALPELARKLGTGGWQAESGSLATSQQAREAASTEALGDLSRPWRQQDLSSLLAGEGARGNGEHSHPGSTSEGSEGGNGTGREAALRHDSADSENSQQRSGQQSDLSGQDTHNPDSPRRDRRGRQQNWNRTWTGLNSAGLNSAGLNSAGLNAGAPANPQAQSD